jgi:hypothetical protein
MSLSKFGNAPSEKTGLVIVRRNEIETSLRLNEKLARALEATFPASDALSSLHVVQPA